MVNFYENVCFSGMLEVYVAGNLLSRSPYDEYQMATP